jgi:polysaccharide biosynthesis/export protein
MKDERFGLVLCECLLICLSPIIASGQEPVKRNTEQPPSPTTMIQTLPSQPDVPNANGVRRQEREHAELARGVVIGPGDELDISVYGVPELSQHMRVGSTGEVSLPLIGNVHVAGLSNDTAQALIERRLADGHFLNNPHVSVYVKEYTTEGISLVGEVNKPGVYSALGAHRLLDLIQTAGGLTVKAGRTATVAHRDDLKQPVTLMLSDDADKIAENNIELLPGDTVVISKAGIVYVVGEINRPGGFVIEGNKISASQVLAMAAGPTRMAALNKSKIIRHTPEGLKDMPLPFKKVLEAKVPDIQLQADDIIWIPNSKTASLATATTSTILTSALSLAIYRL